MTHARNDWRKLLALSVVAMCCLLPLTAPAQQSAGLEEVVVTAQRRAQNINDVGIAITAFDAEVIEELALRQPLDVANQTTNFSVNTAVTSIPNFTIRGVGVNDYAINQATSVGSYVDQVFVATPAMLLFQIFDTRSIEVLKGPQGTLYGRNTTGGAVLFNSKEPTNEFTGSVNLEVGNYDHYLVEGAISGPLTDSVNGRVAFNTTQGGGYQKSVHTGREHGDADVVSVRAIVDWQATADLDLRFKAYAGEDKSGLLSFNTAELESNDTTTGTIDTLDGVPYRDNQAWGASLIANWDVGAVTLTSVTAYDDLDRFEYRDSDGLFLDGRIDQQLISDIYQFSQELRVASSGNGPVLWVAGLYYSKDKIDDLTDYELTGSGFPPAIFGVPSPYAALDALGNTFLQRTESRAVFGQVEWDLAEKWHLTGGLRYTREAKDLDDVTTPWTDGPGPGEIGPVLRGVLFPASSYSEDFEAVSGKLAVDYRPNNDTLIYAGINRGFKSGGFQGSLVFDPANIFPFEEETVLAYEVGAKFTLLDNTLQLNPTVFFYDYENLQAQGTIVGGAGGVQNLFALQNVGDAEVLGFEIDLQASPVAGLDLAFGVGYLDAKIVDPFIAEVDKDGRPALSPKWNFNGRLQYAFANWGPAHWFVQTDFKYQDDVFFDIYETPFLHEDAYFLWNAGFGLAASDNRWRATAWVRNIGDTEYRVSGLTGGVAGPIHVFGAPRTFGVNLSYDFK